MNYEEYSPFIDWELEYRTFIHPLAEAFRSLVLMVRNGYIFDGELLDKVKVLLSTIRKHTKRSKDVEEFLNLVEGIPTISPELSMNLITRLKDSFYYHRQITIDDELEDCEPDDTYVVTAFVDSIVFLLSEPDAPFVVDILNLVRHCLDHCSSSYRFALVAEKVIPRILSTPCLEDLSGFASITLLLETTMILDSCLWLSSTDGINIIRTTSDVDLQYVRDMVLHEVFIPMEPSLIQLRHSLDISYLFECDSTLRLLARIFEVSAFHQPTLDFICSSPIPMVYLSLLREVEDDDPKQFFIGLMNDSIRKWKHDGASTWRRGRLLLQTLERGGFLEGFEQELLHSASAEKGRKLKLHSCDFLNLLGMNSPRPELITQNRSTTLQAANLFQ